MATTVPLPLGSYNDQDPRASSKRLVGCFSELTDQDSPVDTHNGQQPAVLRRMPGLNPIVGFGDGSGLPVRGMWEMAGVEYVVIGPNLYSVTFLIGVATLTQLNGAIPITGNTFVRMTDNGACLVILQPGTAFAWTYTPFAGGGGFQPLTTAFFTGFGAIDCWFVDTFIVFLATNGTTFYNDDGRVVSGNAQITFTTAASFTRAFGTDLFAGGTVDHREIMLFGSRTTEGYVNAGNPTGSPFSSAPDSYMQIGCHPLCSYTICLQDQSIFWVANDKTVRRRNGQTPTRVSNSGIEQILSSVDLTGCYGLAPTAYGHPLWVLTIPNPNPPLGTLYSNPLTLVYDCLTSKWFELKSYNTKSWRPLCYHNGFGLQLLGDSISDATATLDEAYDLEFGATQIVEIETQAVYDGDNRIQHRRLEFVATVGGTPSLTVPVVVDLFASDNSGKTFESWVDPQTLGTAGQDEAEGQRAFWFNLGQSRNRVYKFRVTGITPLFSVDIQITLEGGKY